MRILTFFISLGLATTCMAAGRDTVPDSPAVARGGEEMIRSAVVPEEGKAGDDIADAKAAAAPVPVPPLTHYAALWEKSMFTTRDLPAPELPQGPGFADQLVLAGIYEVDGAVVAVILDRMTAQISEARIGSENENGVRIKSVNPGESEVATRIQLQKGMQSGWIAFADGGAGGGGGAGSAPVADAVSGVAPGMLPPGMAPQPLIPPGAGGANGMGDSGAGAAFPGSVVEPLPNMGVNPEFPATPNPVLDEVPLPPP